MLTWRLVQWAVREYYSHSVITQCVVLSLAPLSRPFTSNLSSSPTSQFIRRSVASSLSAAVDLLASARHDHFVNCACA